MKYDCLYAIYNDRRYECSIEGENLIEIYGNRFDKGFEEFMGIYSKMISRNECSRVYRKTLCFKYNNDNFLIREEKDNMVLLETGPRSYDLKKLGFTKILNDTFQKWVNINEGEKYWAITEY